MNQIEKSIFDKMENAKFQKMLHDDISFVDNIIDQTDINRVFDEKKEDTNDEN